jgi:hypothetical protein
MDVFQEYKRIRNKIALLASDDALGVIWSYCQFLQLPDFRFPPEIEVSKDFLAMDIPQTWISEWEPGAAREGGHHKWKVVGIEGLDTSQVEISCRVDQRD